MSFPPGRQVPPPPATLQARVRHQAQRLLRNIKFDASGNLWVANTGNTDLIQFSASQQSTLLGGGSGNVAPAVTITSSAFSAPWDVAFDSSGTIYVADEGAGYIEVFPSSASGSSKPTFEMRLPAGP